MKRIGAATFTLFTVASLGSSCALAQDDPKATERWEPVPKVVTPGAKENAPPSDAVVLFDGRDLRGWEASKDQSPAAWKVHDGIVTVDKTTGNIQTRQRFHSYQLHLEWQIPRDITGEGQGRGNSGVFLASTGPGDEGYEVQIMDSFENATYVNGQAASIYKQAAPLVNAARHPGDWQTYDIVWTAPVFAADGSVKSPAYLTLFHNGVLVQNHTELTGETFYIGKPKYKPYTMAAIKLQAHGDHSQPISFRNIWVRPLD
ncbi:MAG: DUF1080 domain-containing protein [Luteibacter sp.]|uniref:3-keto-disaccharide hydrolase n=1 Tax=Luteibacter sp. TaxID=1886636 RepID=UPI00280A0C12|nr:DUF1080 domain-containing protein [Luteibacter sp.]MDQ7994994.1 DUF1080 domain-containing protein [Luteibacter sp.]MDQ8047490.1 DUF1080 domain-containing protein [Luteibacter sp.]